MLSVYAVGKYGQQELVNSIYYLAASLGCQASLVVATGCQCCHEDIFNNYLYSITVPKTISTKLSL